jgi:hypothetical protein
MAASGPPADRWYEAAYASPGWRDAAVTAPDQETALAAARHMSARGRLVDVTLILGHTGRRPVASFADGLPVPGLAARVPAAADAARDPVPGLPGTGDSSAAPGYPGGISPLPVTATSGGALRPHRLLHPDGTRLTCRPDGCRGRRWAGIAAGVLPGDGDQRGWLQVVQRGRGGDPGGPVTAHPALISPAGTDPYAGMGRRQRRRFRAFDAAEAAGRPAARLPATLIDAGDIITAAGQDGICQVSEAAMVCGALGVSVRLLAEDLSGGTDMRICRGGELVEVMLPIHHPAEYGPQARRLFATGRPGRPFRAPLPALLWDGGR